MFFYRKPIFENWVPNKKSIFHPLGVNFMSKITSDSDSSSKNTSVWVKPKFKKSGFVCGLFWFSWKNQKLKISIFWLFYQSLFWGGLRGADEFFGVPRPPWGWENSKKSVFTPLYPLKNRFLAKKKFFEKKFFLKKKSFFWSKIDFFEGV